MMVTNVSRWKVNCISVDSDSVIIIAAIISDIAWIVAVFGSVEWICFQKADTSATLQFIFE